MGASVRNHTESEMARLNMLMLLLPSLILADGPGGHHHGGHHGDHGAHHGAHNENHAHAGGAAHHADHGASHHPVQHSVSQGPQDLAQLIASHPKLTTLNAAVKAAGLEATLASPGPFTVFAPTNLAFKKIPDADLQRLLGDKAALSKILLRHVVPGTKMQGKNIPPGVTNLKTAAGEQISATRDKFIQVKSKEGSAFIVLF